MIGKIIGTIGSRLFAGLVLLVVLGLHSKNLGAEVLGKLAIFRLSLTINHMFSSVFSGPAVVYIGNRISINKMVVPGILWVLLCSFLLSIVQCQINIIPFNYFWPLVVLSLLYSIQSFLEQVLLSKQKVYLYNASTFIHHFILLFANLIFIFYIEEKNENVFFNSMGIALFTSSIFLLFITHRYFNVKEFIFRKKIAGIMFYYGIWGQLNNVIQTLNYRISLLFLDYCWNKKVVGYFSAGLQLAEAVWIISKSMATVQYAKISSHKTKEYAIELTLLMSKTSLALSLFASVLLVLLPEQTLIYYLGNDFANIKTIVLFLLPGILFFSVSLIQCHYFSGTGRFYLNTVGSVISLVLISGLGFFLIPLHGASGAAIANSIGLLGMLLFNLFILLSVEKISFRKMLPGLSDIRRSKKIIREILNKS